MVAALWLLAAAYADKAGVPIVTYGDTLRINAICGG